MLSFLLLKQIAQLFLVMLAGWAIVKLGILKSEDSRPLSMILLYVVTPCVTVKAFQLEWTRETGEMMLLSAGVGLLLNILPLLLIIPSDKLFHLRSIEKASVIYSNASNLAIPLVAALFGQEWIAYVSIYSAIQIVLVWTHGRKLVSGRNDVSAKQLLKNVNIIVIALGLLLFFTQIRLPAIVQGALTQISALVGPLAMVIIGMLMAAVDFQNIRKYTGIWRVVLLRLIIFPVIATLLVKYSGLSALAPNGETLLLISLLSSVAPTANVVTQFSQLYDNEPEYSSLINVVTLLLSIITMPLMVALYQM